MNIQRDRKGRPVHPNPYFHWQIGVMHLMRAAAERGRLARLNRPKATA